MRHLFPHSTRYPSRIRARRRKEAVMNHLYDRQDSTTALPTKTLRVPRRDFLKTSAAIGGGLCFAAYVPELAPRPLKDSPANDGRRAPAHRQRNKSRRRSRRRFSENRGGEPAMFSSGAQSWSLVDRRDGS